MHERRIIEGALACPICETHYPVHRGIAWLRFERETGTHAMHRASNHPCDEQSIRIAALLGAAEPLGFILLLGPAACAAVALARMVEGTEIITDASHSPEPGGADAVSRIAIGHRLPVLARKLRGIWLSGEHADDLLEEAARALHPLGRLVLEPAPADTAARLEAVGLRVVAREDRTVLAVHSTGPQIASSRGPSLS